MFSESVKQESGDIVADNGTDAAVDMQALQNQLLALRDATRGQQTNFTMTPVSVRVVLFGFLFWRTGQRKTEN